MNVWLPYTLFYDMHALVLKGVKTVCTVDSAWLTVL